MVGFSQKLEGGSEIEEYELVVCSGTSKVWRCCIDRPRQSFDYGVMGVNHPAAGVGVENSAMVLL